MQSRDKIILQKICSEIGLILKFIGEKNLEEFLKDELTKHAVGMTLINIGEFTKHLSDDLIKNYSEVDWKKVAEFGDIVAYKYELPNMTDVYNTITKNFPEMKNQIEKILELDPEKKLGLSNQEFPLIPNS